MENKKQKPRGQNSPSSGWRGVAREPQYTPSKGPVAPTFSALKGGVALQVASWKVSLYKGLSQLHCRQKPGGQLLFTPTDVPGRLDDACPSLLG